MEEKWYYASFVALDEVHIFLLKMTIQRLPMQRNGQRMVRIMMTLVMWIWSWFRFVRLTLTMSGKRLKQFGFN